MGLPFLLSALALQLALAASCEALTLTPITRNGQSQPYSAVLDDPARYDYVEEEYLVAGVATVYGYGPDRSLVAQPEPLAYRSRMLVRRPADLAGCNGIVVLEMLNPSAGFDIDFIWHYTRPYLVEEGFVWAGVTIRRSAIEDLRRWDSARYGTLDVPDDGVAYSLFGELAALLGDVTNAANPLAGCGVTQVLGAGYSQAADYLTSFSNEFHEEALGRGGRPALSGYLAGGGSGGARGLNDAEAGVFSDRRRLNRVDAPYIRVQSESEITMFRLPASAARQPDSDVFRQWEVAGSTHADEEILGLTRAVIARDRGAGAVAGCTLPPNPLPISPVYRSALKHLVDWVRLGRPPPPSRWIETDAGGAIRRDGDGNAIGGIRLPPLEVPTGTFLMENTGPGPCVLAGSYRPFDTARRDAVYADRDFYLSAYWNALAESQDRGYLLPSDAGVFRNLAARLFDSP